MQCLLSPPQRLLLVNTSESKNTGAGALAGGNGSAGNDGKREDYRRSLRRREQCLYHPYLEEFKNWCTTDCCTQEFSRRFGHYTDQNTPFKR